MDKAEVPHSVKTKHYKTRYVTLVGFKSCTNMGSKNKKRVVLPSRPDQPTVVQILEDINNAFPNDPVFRVLSDGNQDARESPDNNVESMYLQGRRYLELNEQLQEARCKLVRQREELQTAGKQLELSVAEVKGRAL